MSATCGKTWTRKFLVSAMTHTFINKTYRAYQERVFFEQEQALLPATQLLVEDQIRRERDTEEINELTRQIQALVTQREALRYHHRHVAAAPATERRQFIRRCGDSECRGFLSTAWKCGLCETYTCKECLVIKPQGQPEHVCNPDNVETAKLLAADSKPCPKCATLIFKIEGCDQMWCTQCHTAFSWLRGSIESNIHNPHYYEWMRRNGGMPRQAGDIPCGGLQLNQNMLTAEQHTRLNALNNTLTTRFFAMVRSTMHIQRVELPRFDVHRANRHQDNQELRIKYMRQHITEDAFRTQLQRAHKSREKQREIHDAISVYVQSMTDILTRFAEVVRQLPRTIITSAQSQAQQQAVQSLTALLEEPAALKDYVNECLTDLSRVYNCVRYSLQEGHVRGDVRLVTEPKHVATVL